MKNPLIPAGIEPATFRFVAQHLNRCATAVPDHKECYGKIKTICIVFIFLLQDALMMVTSVAETCSLMSNNM